MVAFSEGFKAMTGKQKHDIAFTGYFKSFQTRSRSFFQIRIAPKRGSVCKKKSFTIYFLLGLESLARFFGS